MATTSQWYDGKQVTVLTCEETANELREVLQGTFPGVEFDVTALGPDADFPDFPKGLHVSWIRGSLSPENPSEEENCGRVVKSLTEYRVGRKYDEGHNRYVYSVYPRAYGSEYGPGDYETYDTTFAEFGEIVPRNDSRAGDEDESDVAVTWKLRAVDGESK
jgi:hypothetical protein